MAGPVQQVRRPTAKEAEVLREQAEKAAEAFRRYMLGGNPAHSKQFWAIYNSKFAGKPVTEQTAFMDKYFSEMKKVVGGSVIKPMWEAFKKDNKRLFVVLWPPNPSHYTDFIKTAEKIRTALTKGVAKDKSILRLTKLVTKFKGQKLSRKDSMVARVRQLIKRRTGLDMATFWKIHDDKAHRKHRDMVSLYIMARKVKKQMSHKKEFRV